MAPGDFPFFQLTRDKGILRDLRMKIRLPDGAVRRISMNAAPLAPQDGTVQVVCTVTDLADQLAAEDALRETAAQTLHEALQDPMTGRPNRALFEDHLDMAIRQTGSLAAIFLDVGDFKAVNDRLGQRQGDALIRMIANRLKAQRMNSAFCSPAPCRPRSPPWCSH